MMATMPDIVLRRNAPSAAVETPAADFTSQDIVNADNMSKTRSSLASDETCLLASSSSGNNSSRVTALLHTCSSPKHFIGINIESSSGNVVKGVFIDGQFVSYMVNVNVHELHLQASNTQQQQRRGGQQCHSYRLETRTSDLRTLYHSLTKDHPWVAIPPVPSKNYRITATARSPHRPKKQETKTLYRRRAFESWLQFVANLQPLQSDPALLMFLTGKAQSLCADSESAESGSTAGSCSSSDLSIYAQTFSERRVREQEPEGMLLSRNMKVFLQSAVAANSGASGGGRDEDWADGPSFAQLMPSPYLTQEECADSSRRGNLQLFSLQTSAYQDLRKVERWVTVVQYALCIYFTLFDL